MKIFTDRGRRSDPRGCATEGERNTKGDEDMKNERSLKDLTEQMEEGYRWLARKKNNWLYTFKDIPKREGVDWVTSSVDCEVVQSYISEFYSTIKSEDKNPTDLVVFLVIKATEEIS